MKYWEIIADDLKKAGWTYGYVSPLGCHSRTTWVADAHRDWKRFVVRADEKVTAFLKLERTICIHRLTQRANDLGWRSAS
jgi:hypothetical protein